MSNERYEIRGKIGQGGVGAVYRAYDTQLRREVAIKRVLAEGGYEDADLATKNLLKEATALSSVQHPHICTVYDAGIDKEGPYVVMELINGKTLDEMVERGTLTYDDFREVAIQSQEAMIAAQDLDLVHRDLKPSNVMVCWLPSGRFQVKLVDFGLAKFSAKPSLQTIDHGDAVFGSIFFMAPEQFERTPLDRRTDMYALGCMYYYALAGTYPFNGDSAPQVMASHLQNSVQPLHELRPDLPTWLCDWVMWHINRNMDHRPESARAALEKYLADESTGTSSSAAPAMRTAPQLIVPASGPQAVQPSAAGSINTATAPQPISPPSGGHSLTSSQSVRPATAITGGTAVQPARPQVGAQPLPNQHLTAATPNQPAQANTAAQATTPTIPKQAQGKAPMSKTTKTVIYSVLGAAIVLFSILIISRMSSNKEAETFNRLVEEVRDQTARDLPTSEEEMTILLKSLTEGVVEQRAAVFQRLLIAKPTGSYNPDTLILEYATSDVLGEDDRERLFSVISRRGDSTSIDALLDYAAENPKKASAQFAIAAANKKVKEKNFPTFLSILASTDNNDVRSAAEFAIANIIKESNAKGRLSDQLIGAFDNSINKNYRLSMIRLLGTSGTNTAKKKIEGSLSSNSESERIAAATAFGNWPTDDPFDSLIDAYDQEESIPAKRSIFTAATTLLDADHRHDENQLEDRWTLLASYAETNEQKIKIIRAAVNARADWSTTILKYFNNERHEDRVIDLAQRGLSKLGAN